MKVFQVALLMPQSSAEVTVMEITSDLLPRVFAKTVLERGLLVETKFVSVFRRLSSGWSGLLIQPIPRSSEVDLVVQDLLFVQTGRVFCPSWCIGLRDMSLSDCV